MTERDMRRQITRPEVSRRGFIQLGAAAAVGVSLAVTTAPSSAAAAQPSLESGPFPRSAGPPSRQPAATNPSAPPSHPLDPLTANEISTVFSVIKAHANFPQGAFFPIVTLKEPPKSEVLAWLPGQPFRREAFANVFDPPKNQLIEAIVDLRAQKVASWRARPGVQPAVFPSEYAKADAIVRADPRWQAAMRARGLNPDDVYLDVWAPGDASLPAVKPGTRFLRALSFFRGGLPNPYDRPIEGVVVSVDMNNFKVIDVVDTGVRPVNTTTSGSASATRTGLQPLIVTQPNGPSFQINGNAVAWQNWHFRVGFTPREGLVLYQIGYQQNGVTRPIIYRISLDDIFVPYALPDRNWVWRAALDVAEYNLGQYAEPLQANVDVPANAVFLDEVTATDTGSGAFTLPHAIALYERDGGSLWDRTDPSTFVRDARFARELVVTVAYPIGNYTYATNYVFRMDGGIDVRVGATGTTLNQGVRSVAEGDKYGSSVAQNIAAPSHQHFFNFRIDFEVDGTHNRLVEENTHSVESSFGNAFVTDQTVLGSEQFRDLSPGRQWAVQSTTRKNTLGKSTAYELRPLDTAVPYSNPEFAPLQHAQFAQHQLWVTRSRAGELYATGDYPNQGQAGEGLPRYIADRENVDGEDLVVWYTTGLTHLPTVEEYPVMTTDTIGFSLRPNGFFDQNPALDAP